jgi:hypothetical protein
MPFGRGRNWFGRGFWRWNAMGMAGPLGRYAGYWGRGNPYPFCRRFPWMPRGWWAVPSYGPWGPYQPVGGLPYPGFVPARGQPIFAGPGSTPGVWPQEGGFSARASGGTTGG